jgi:dynein heavy chain
MIGFAPWADKVEPFKYSPDQPFSSILVPTVNTTRYTQLLKLCCSIDRPVLMVGLSGVGKSVIMQQQLARTPEHAGQLPVVLHCSASTTSPAVQQLLDNKLVRQGNT